MRPILDVASDLGLTADELVLHGPHVAKLSFDATRKWSAQKPKARIVLVSAMSPTPKGEGKTTVSIGLAQGLKAIGRKAALALREPSLGPIFGAKGGGTGGGQCKVEPSARINLHFTGDLHAITSAHNLLSSLADNALHFGVPAALDQRQVLWPRVLDMNDRFLRQVVIGLGGKENGVPREDRFDITAASEVMAILCLARGVADLKARLGRILVGFSREGGAVTAQQLEAPGAMAALLADALQPNLVQSTEGCPAFVHGGPFANIAHGCNSILATRCAAALADFVITEAGFGFDLGAEKFLDIKCRTADVWPSAVVLVGTAKALRYHGGDTALSAQGKDALHAITRGMGNLEKQVDSARAFGFDPIVALNRFPDDAPEHLAAVESECKNRGIAIARFNGFAEGGAGAKALAELVAAQAGPPAPAPRFLYALEDSPEKKIQTIATRIYGARSVSFSAQAKKDLERVAALDLTKLPVCIAKSHLSLSGDPKQLGRPTDFEFPIRQVRVSAGAGFMLALAGDILTMPGLPKSPAGRGIDLTEGGEITGVG